MTISSEEVGHAGVKRKGGEELWSFESQLEEKPGGQQQKVVLGVDGGGSNTRCVCVATPLPSRVEDLRSLALAETGASNRNSVGEGVAKGAIEESIAGGLKEAQVPRSAVLAICLALAGVDRKEDIDSYLPWIRAIFPGDVKITVVTDAVAALASGTAGRLYGCVLIAGTGTVALGFDEDKNFKRASGGGPRLGDKGSGHAIAVEALGAVMKAYDGRGPSTTLAEKILEELKLASAEDLLGWAYREQGWARVASLAAVVKACAKDGDKVAINILDEAVSELVCSVKAVIQSLTLHGEDGKKRFPFVMVGGVLENRGEWDLCKPIAEKVTGMFPGAQAIQPKVEPAFGSAMLAWNLYQDSLSKDGQENAEAVEYL